MKLNGVLVHGWVTLRLAMSDEECRLRIIGWLIEGLGIDDTDADGRTLHLQVGPLPDFLDQDCIVQMRSCIYVESV